ncbi:hypothetical protein PR202_ga15639 [Eleusine coracana subsp. coracana]|uniref:Fucosyltransferase n=1 Tax=Eleusine coracana subsp. coracana TaxID=191504 RepID=A0AAV5CKS2_ELECO|nr:hypothetical protein QOZ80_6BG0490820 [Eleusine coracana subsp. coracana]GJM98611.1 hypothetical protein PR202_ga15639 [Eleusine coracana subsp. coracana]
MDRTRLPPHPPAARSPAWPFGLLVALCCFTTLPLLFAMAPGRPALSDVWRQMGIRVTVSYDDQKESSEPNKAPPPESSRDVLLGGLLSPDIAEPSCLSRYKSSLYRKRPSPHSPSPYLVSRLRKYEALHRRCGPGTLAYDKSLSQLSASPHSLRLVECSYLVWTPPSSASGSPDHLGDRMLSLSSAFLYALLTHRVLLAHLTDDMAGLFCDPFPGASSWELPTNGFPLMRDLTGLHRGSARSYGNLHAVVFGADTTAGKNASQLLPSYAYAHLERDYQVPDQRFFCDADQAVLARVNWLVLRSDQYFAPGLFLVPRFEDELRWMFPAPDTVFHHVARYLFHPSNSVWDLVVRYHASYMARFHHKIGVQIADVLWNPVSTEEYIEQIAACTSQEKILPEVVDPDAAVAATSSSTAVVVSAAQPQFADWLNSMYPGHATVTGEAVSVLRLSVGKQHPQNVKALAEMFLQSFCDAQVVSGWSAAVYVSHGFAGVRPWMLLPPRNGSPPCVRTASTEPCFHAPPSYECRAEKSGGDLGAVLRHVRRCEDVTDGIKLFHC